MKNHIEYYGERYNNNKEIMNGNTQLIVCYDVMCNAHWTKQNEIKRRKRKN